MGSNGNGQAKKKMEKNKRFGGLKKNWKRLEVKRGVVAELYH